MERITIYYLPEVSDAISGLHKGFEDLRNVSFSPAKKSGKQEEHFDFHNTVDIAINFYNQYGSYARELFGKLLIDAVKEAFKTLVKAKEDKRSVIPPCLEIELNYTDVKAKITIAGQLTDKQLETTFKELHELLSSGQVKKDFQNPQYHKAPDNSDDIKYFRTEGGLLIPHDQTEERQALLKRMQDLGH